MNATSEQLAPLAGWDHWRWSPNGRILIGLGPDGERRSLGELSGQEPNLLVELIGPKGGLISRDTAADEDEGRSLMRSMVIEAGGLWSDDLPAERPATLGEWCRDERTRRGWTQMQMTRLLQPIVGNKLQQGMLSAFERGLLVRAPITREHLESLFAAHPVHITEPAGSRAPDDDRELVALLDRLGVPKAPKGHGTSWRLGWVEGKGLLP